MQGLKKHWKWVVAIIAMQFITMGTVGVAPALAQIGAAFPDKSAEEIQLLMSIPSLGTVIASLVAVPVAARLGRRKSVILGLVIFCVTGLMPCFVENWTLIILSRFGIGVGCGFVNPLNTAAIFSLFNEGEDTAHIQTYNAGLRNRLAAFSKKYPDLCRLEKTYEQGGVSYVLDKSRLSIRLQPPYSEERRRKASENAKQNGFVSQTE